MLDPAIGNWDFFADHVTQQELACAGEAILRSDGLAPVIYNRLTCVLGDMIWDVAGRPGARLHDVSSKVRAFGYQSLADAMRLNPDVSTGTRAGWMALASAPARGCRPVCGRYVGHHKVHPPLADHKP
ncbi:hypothetical protein NHF48_023515 [Sphingomonas sp. H160509]|uniref:hypothetical protein n=1 Tax=Sphingomonas sp. H160509 TaxID=2955313 RepID=UPI002096F1A7|nr:hypothetical protein [Sphingomonas sp. H160509]MDD1453233.1 hypothetical protein [Sphingomonas sp. H160509]